MVRPTNPRKFLADAETSAINVAVREAERKTSAELKVVIARHCWGNLKTKARNIFGELRLDKTEQRNCVLILLVVANREFLIYGDEGIHARVGQGFWDDVCEQMREAFRRDEFGEGIAGGVRRIGEKLAQYFPHEREDVDEISNEIVYPGTSVRVETCKQCGGFWLDAGEFQAIRRARQYLQQVTEAKEDSEANTTKARLLQFIDAAIAYLQE